MLLVLAIQPWPKTAPVEGLEIVDYCLSTVEDFRREVQSRPYAAIYAGWMGFVKLGGCFGEVLAAIPASVKVISACTAGVDAFDTVGLAAKGILLCSVPSEVSLHAEKVADLALWHVLEGFRHISVLAKALKETQLTTVARHQLAHGLSSQEHGTITYSTEPASAHVLGHQMGHLKSVSPFGKTALVVGFGNIGQAVGRRLAAMGMKIEYTKRSNAVVAYPATRVELEDGVARADVVVVCLPGGPATKRAISRDLVGQFKQGSRLVNVGRGSVVDEQAVVDALATGRLSYAGLDVFEEEPAVHPGLVGRVDAVVTPHVGSVTVETWNDTAAHGFGEIKRVLAGAPPLHRVN